MLLNLILSTVIALNCAAGNPDIKEGIQGYTPTTDIMASREAFSDNKFGIFIHWGIYSMMGDGEWIMNNSDIQYSDYSQLAEGFYPSKFNAAEWVSAIKASGAKYITITSRHHDGFSMFGTKASKYNIVDASPFGRDILKELANECQKQGIVLNFYYSLLDWGRGDYPMGRTGHNVGKDPTQADYNHYLDFMCQQITELLTNYGPIGCIWFDGDWDLIGKKENGEADINFDWQYGRIYSLIHSLQPKCLVANNHHRVNIPGEDIQIFERDVPGENTSGFSKTDFINKALPLESCETMNKCWGYNITDHQFKSTTEIIHLLLKAAGRNSNLLLNVGPQPNGQIPATSLERFKEIGQWMNKNGETIYGTRATLMKPQPWGVVTHKDNRIFLHVTSMPEGGTITLPFTLKVKSVKAFGSGEQISYKRGKKDFTVTVPETADCTVDYIIEITKK